MKRATDFAGMMALLIFLLAGVALAEDNKDYVPKTGEFPPPGAGAYFAGELVSVDHVNRRGALRLDGDYDKNRYHSAPSHQFAMLPYGAIWYHGAPAAMQDVPIGTHLHGTFLLPPAGDKTIPPPPQGMGKYVPKYNHALLLEDDFSFYQHQGQAWKIISIDLANGQVKATRIGPDSANGITGEKIFTMDRSTRIWKSREFAELEVLAAGQTVQLNLTWAPEWEDGQFHLADVWIDDASRAIATERQRQIHLRYQHNHWLAGWINQVEHEKDGKGIVTITLFGGMDPSLYNEARAQAKHNGNAFLAVAESTLRTWWQDHDCKTGAIIDLKEIPNPPPGSSGLQFRLGCNELLEGFRPNRFIRFGPSNWPRSKLPAEERIKTMDDR